MKDELLAEGDSDGAGALDLNDLLQGLLRSRYWIILCLGLGGIAGAGYGLTLEDEYQSLAKVRVRMGLRERRTVEAAIEDGPDVGPGPGITDELLILNNREVYERVALEVGVERLLKPSDPTLDDDLKTMPYVRKLHEWQADYFASKSPLNRPGFDPESESAIEAAAGYVRGAINVEPVRNSSFLIVTANTRSPELSQEVVTAFLRVAQAWHREFFSGEKEIDFVTDQLQKYDRESVDAEERFLAHRKDCGFFDIDAQIASITQRIDDMDAELDRNDLRLIEIEDNLLYLAEELKNTPETVERVIPSRRQINPEYEMKRDELQRQINARSSLEANYKEDSDRYRREAPRIDAAIQEVQLELAGIEQYIDMGADTVEEVTNPRYEALLNETKDLESEQRRLRRSTEQRKRLREAQSHRLAAAFECRPTHRTFATQVSRTTTRQNELTILREREEVLGLLDTQDSMSSLRVVEGASLPRYRIGPKRERFLGIGLVAGLMAGLGIGFLRYLMDPKIRHAQNIEKALGIPLLGEIPRNRKLRKLRLAGKPA